MVDAKRLLQRFYPTSSPFRSFSSTEELPFPKDLDRFWHLQSSFFSAVVGYWGKLLIQYGNSLQVYNHETFLQYFGREKNVPLLTFCNHHSMLDDPGLVGALIENKTMYRSKEMRWVFGAKEILFSNPIFSYICSHGKVIPTIRGDGVYQPAVNFALKQLNNGSWIHIFPEAKVTMDPIRLKWGIGRLIAECMHTPVILPFWHVGMHEVLPCTKPLIPRLRKRVTVLFGEPIAVADVISKCKSENVSEEATRKIITDLMQEHLYRLKEQAEHLHASRIS